jgi:hypothetical protein
LAQRPDEKPNEAHGKRNAREHRIDKSASGTQVVTAQAEQQAENCFHASFLQPVSSRGMGQIIFLEP